MRLLSIVNANNKWSALPSTLFSVLWLLALLLQPAECDNDGLPANTTIAAIFEKDNDNLDRKPCPLPPPIKARYMLSEANMTDIYEAAKLSWIVYPDVSGRIEWQIQEQRKHYQLFDGWGDWDDQTVVAKTDDNACHAAFAASSCWNPFDQWQNLSPFPKRLGENCWVRRGYYNAYNTSYKDDFRYHLDSCINSCGPDTPCRLILSGYSQGGAVAIAAAVDLKHYNPLTITFGAPQPFLQYMGDCRPDFDAARHFQFVGTLNGRYDRVAQQYNPYFASHLGTVFLLDGGDDLIGFPSDSLQRRRPRSYLSHVLYPWRIANIYNRGCFPVVVGGWRSGHDCNYDDECDSGVCGQEICQQSVGY